MAASRRNGGRRATTVPLEVLPDVARGSGRRAARLDLESGFPLGDRTAFQDGLVSAYQEAVANEMERDLEERGEPLGDLADVECELVWREAEVEDANARIEKVDRRRERLANAGLIGQIPLTVFLCLMGLFAAAEYPLLRLSFTRLPLDDTMIRLVSLLVGLVLVAAVDVIGLIACRVVRAEGERVEGRRDWLLHALLLGFGCCCVVATVVWLALLRASEIAAVGTAFQGRGVGHPAWLGAALGFLHALVLLAAFYLAYQRARASELLKIEKTIDEIGQERKTAEERLEELERKRERLLVRLDLISQRTGQRLERLLHHHEHEEADYLAILRRELQAPPSPINDWETGAAARLGTSNGRPGKNGHGRPAWTTAARRVKRALREHDEKERTS